MSLWYTNTAIEQINQYLGQIEDGIVAVAAKEEVRREIGGILERTVHTKGRAGSPWENELVYDFLLDSAGRRRGLVVYQVSEERNRIEILLFRQHRTSA
jgi:hypothetical protein